MTDSSITHLDHSEIKSSLPEESVFIVTLSNHYGLIRFSGEDAQTFLQGQLTCDLRHITAEQASYGGYCTPKGRVLANFLLWQCDHSYFMQLPVSLCDSMQKKLSLYKLRARVSIENVSQDYTCIGLAGPQATKILGALLTSIPAFDRSLQFIFNDEIAVVYFASDRIQVILPRENAESALESLCRHAPMADILDWERLTIRAGIPVILPQTQEEFLPQMINLNAIGALSFKKGCYPGQEIVARTQYLGKLKRHMYCCFIAKVEKTATVNPGDLLYSANMPDQACGTIVNAVHSNGGFDALAVIQHGCVEGGEVHWGSLQGPVIQINALSYSLSE